MIVEKDNRRKNEAPAVFKAGAVSLAFLIIGYQVALFVHRVSVERIAAVRDHPDTVFVVDSAVAARILSACSGNPASCYVACDTSLVSAPASPQLQHDGRGNVVIRKDDGHSEPVKKVREMTRKVESFMFNPNTASVEDLQRLGFSEKQALSIDNYRQKGGKFRRKEDFAKSFVVSDSVYSRLERFIDIPLLDINKADSAAFDGLPGIGGYFAAKMVEQRKKLGGYSYPEQLMDIWRFDREKYDALADLICCSPPRDSFDMWKLPTEKLREHPYIRSWQVARAIVLYRDNNPRSGWTVDGIQAAGIIGEEDASKLRRCAIKRP